MLPGLVQRGATRQRCSAPVFPVHHDTQLNVADDANPGINQLDIQPQRTVLTCCHGDSSRRYEKRAEIRFEGRVKSSGDPTRVTTQPNLTCWERLTRSHNSQNGRGNSHFCSGLSWLQWKSPSLLCDGWTFPSPQSPDLLTFHQLFLFLN